VGYFFVIRISFKYIRVRSYSIIVDGGDVIIKCERVKVKENSMSGLGTGWRTWSSLGTHSRFRSKIMIVSEVLMKRILG